MPSTWVPPSSEWAWLAIVDHICTGISHCRDALYAYSFNPFSHFSINPISHHLSDNIPTSIFITRFTAINDTNSDIFYTHIAIYTMLSPLTQLSASFPSPVTNTSYGYTYEQPFPTTSQTPPIMTMSMISPNGAVMCSPTVTPLPVSSDLQHRQRRLHRLAVNFNTLNGPETDEKKKGFSICTSNGDCAASG